MVVHARYPLAEPRVQREALAAKRAGFDVDVICLREAGEAASEMCEGVRVLRLPIRHVRGGGAARTLMEYLGFALLSTVVMILLHIRRRYDVVQVHGPPDFLVVSGLFPRLLGARLWLDIHDLSPHLVEARLSVRTSGILKRPLRAVERISCWLANGVITIHEPYRAALVADGVPPNKIVTVLNAPDERRLTPYQRQDRKPGEGFHVAYHGTINSWFGLDLLIEAIAHVRRQGIDAHATILGDGDALDHCRQLAEFLDIGRWIRFSGRYLPLDEALSIVSQADCGVVPNRATALSRYALSTKLLEYVALGIPVVAARFEVLATHFSDAEITYFSPGDTEELARALLWVARNPDIARARADRARSRAASYSWTENAARYVAAIAGTQ